MNLYDVLRRVSLTFGGIAALALGVAILLLVLGAVLGMTGVLG